jgi:hypothetical protein
MPVFVNYKPGPCYRKNRLAARILLRRQKGQLCRRDIRVARKLVRDPALSDRLIDQALHALQAPA